MSEQVKLWFFRDLNDAQRLKLFGLFGLPVDEIGNVQGRQMIALKHIGQTLIKMVMEEAAAAPPLAPAVGYQDRVAAAHHALFHDDPTDIAERLARYAEETNEVLQAFGMSREDMHQLVDYTCDRPPGEPAKEIGAALLTLTSLCVIAGYDIMACGEADLEKLQRPETIARIRAKRSTRHGRGPLPGIDPSVRIAFGLEAQGHIPTVEAMLADGLDWPAIGRRIGWHGETAKQYYERHLARAAPSSPMGEAE